MLNVLPMLESFSTLGLILEKSAQNYRFGQLTDQVMVNEDRWWACKIGLGYRLQSGYDRIILVIDDEKYRRKQDLR